MGEQSQKVRHALSGGGTTARLATKAARWRISNGTITILAAFAAVTVLFHAATVFIERAAQLAPARCPNAPEVRVHADVAHELMLHSPLACARVHRPGEVRATLEV